MEGNVYDQLEIEAANAAQARRLEQHRVAQGKPAPDASAIEAVPPKFRQSSAADYVALGMMTEEQVADEYRQWDMIQTVKRNPAAVDELLAEHRLATAEWKRREAIAGHKVPRPDGVLPSWTVADLESARWTVQHETELDPNPAGTLRALARDEAAQAVSEAQARLAAISAESE